MHPETPSDPPLKTLEIETGPIAYTDEGGGEHCILAVAGLPGTVRDFRWLAPALTEHARFIRIDLPGFGGSPRQDFRGWTIAERAEPVQALIEELELQDLTLIGHSSGGTVVAHLGRRLPERIARCGLIACPGVKPHYPLGLYAFLTGIFRSSTGRALMMPIQRLIYRAAGFPSYLSDDERMYTTLDAAAKNFARHEENVRALSQPTLVAWAEDDRLIPAKTLQGLAAIAPPGPRLSFKEGGHNIQKTQALAIAEALLAMYERPASSS